MFGNWRFASSLTVLAGCWILAASASPGAQDISRNPPRIDAPSAQSSNPKASLDRYCVTCHNDRLKTAGLSLAAADFTQVGAHAELWEKVVRKLRTGAMPPAGARRPDEATYDAVASWLEGELDRAAAAKPNAGSLPLLHRLTRTEYQNAVRDLLAIDALPKEMEYSLLLPPDNASSGFDNIAELLFVSPAIMERYLDASRKISRLAIGDPALPLMVDTYRLPGHLPQDRRMEDLPFGTRGGLAVRTTLPLDGEYLVRIELVGFARERHEIEVSVDGVRAQVIAIGEAPPAGRSGSAAPGRGRGRGRGTAANLDVRIPIDAGPRLIGVTFVERTEARDEETVRPRMRGRGTLPAIGSVTITGPYNATVPADTPSRRRIFICHPGSGQTTPAEEQPPASAKTAIDASEDGCARQILANLARRAYRRPATDEDLLDLLPFYETGRRAGGFDAGIRKALERLLVSPQFLFRIEREPASLAPGTPYRITDLELASRLSFFIWSSIPDDELLDAAVQDRLHDPAVLERQARRMLADERAGSLVTNFAAQWLFLRDLEQKKPDELLFPDFDEGLRAALIRETELFLWSVFHGDGGVLDLLDADYTFVNERLATHYGIPNVKGSHFRRVGFDTNSQRGGLLGHGSILTLTSYANRTSPVLRGKWVLENLLSSPPPPPPADVPPLKTEGEKPGLKLSMREAMIQHRANPACAGCHAQMDPIGFAMENFDAVGRWRDRDSGVPIDASGALPGGAAFDGIAGLKRAMLAHPERFVTTVAEKLLMYAIGRNLQYYDAPAVRAIVRQSEADGYTFASLVLGVVRSTPFQMRTSVAGGPAARPIVPPPAGVRR
jgi:hypothetical protein